MFVMILKPFITVSGFCSSLNFRFCGNSNILDCYINNYLEIEFKRQNSNQIQGTL